MCFNHNNRNNANPVGSQKTGLQTNNKKKQQKKGVEQPWKSKIDELRQQVNKITKLLNAMASKLGVTVEKKMGDKVVINSLSHITEEKKKGGNKETKQDMFPRHNSEEKKEAYNPEKEINEIKKTLEPIMILLKQVEKQAGKSKSMETDEIKEEQFDFVVITETKLTPIKEKSVFFGTEEYHAFWESSTKKQMGTGVSILIIASGTVHMVGLYMPASKAPTEKTVAKEIRKLLADIVQNKEIVIVAGDLNEDLAAKSLEETIAMNKEKKCSTTTLLQQINLVDIHGMYAVNNLDNTWTVNGVQRRLDYVFTDVVTVSLVTNIGVINVNESFSTDHKAVVTIIRSDRILAGIKKSKSGRKKCSTTMIDVKKASGVQWKIYAKETD
ncbi:hypothetical protein G9A89_019783 [Geosiphon pyriformis]|nr:hypothetical protein G9A89_019783 [Geosiphon pyriformis]